MKKLLALILSSLLLLSLVSCGEAEKKAEDLELKDKEKTTGNLLIPYYDDEEDKYGYVNKACEIVIEPQFDYAALFADNGLAWVKIDDKGYYINEKGEIYKPKK